MRLTKFYKISTLLIILIVASFSTVEAAHYEIKTPQSIEIPPTKMENRKSLKEKTKNIKSSVKNFIAKKITKGKKNEEDNLISGVLSFVFGLLSSIALLAGILFLIAEGGIGFLVLSVIAALAGIVLFVVSMVKTKKSENPTGGIVLSILGIILSTLAGFISSIILYAES